MGNMADALTRKSMRLFADEVAPRLKADSARLFARQFPELERTPEPALIDGRFKLRGSIGTASPTCTASRPTCSRFTTASPGRRG